MQHATCHSLVVLDELGRGTSTFDGYSIAHAVLHHVSSSIACRTLFATHYHGLTSDFSGATNIAMGHMSALVGSAGTGKPLVHCQCCPANAIADTKAGALHTRLRLRLALVGSVDQVIPWCIVLRLISVS